MALELDVRIDTDYMHVSVKGIRNRDGVVEIAKRILEICDEYEQVKILVDVREMKGRLGGLDSYNVVSIDFPELISERKLQVAIVDEDLLEDTITYFERFSQGEGLNFKVFSSTTEASSWLREYD